MLTSLNIGAPYTYRVDSKAICGSHLKPDKLCRVCSGGQTTINICREISSGDDDLIRSADLTGKVTIKHIPIIGNAPPTADDVNELIAYLESAEGTAYVHCEAGLGRTGVMVACCRMAQAGRWPTPCTRQTVWLCDAG